MTLLEENPEVPHPASAEPLLHSRVPLRSSTSTKISFSLGAALFSRFLRTLSIQETPNRRLPPVEPLMLPLPLRAPAPESASVALRGSKNSSSGFFLQLCSPPHSLNVRPTLRRDFLIDSESISLHSSISKVLFHPGRQDRDRAAASPMS